MGQSDSIWKDLSGNGNDGELRNFGYTEGSGWVDGGLKFDGVDDWVEVDNVNTGNSNFTVEMICDIQSDGAYFAFKNQTDNWSFLVQRQTSTSYRVRTWTWLDGVMVGTNYSLTPLEKGTLCFRVLDRILSVFMNGEKKQEISLEEFDPFVKLIIGSYTGGGPNHISGIVNSFKLYNRALTDEEILQNYRATHFLLEPKTFTSNDYYNYYDLNRVEINTLATKDLAEVLRGDINLENIDFDRNMKAFPFADVLNRVEGNINILGNKLYKPKGWTQPKLDWRYNQPFSYEDANRLERNLLLLYNYAKANVDKIPHCGMYTCGEAVV